MNECAVNDGQKHIVDVDANMEATDIEDDPVELKAQLHQFLTVASTARVTNWAEQRSPFWQAFTAADLSEPALLVHQKVPSARPAVFEYVELLALESANVYLYRQEVPQRAAELRCEAVDTAAELLIDVFEENALDEHSKSQETVFQWSLRVVSLVRSSNSMRPAVKSVSVNEQLTLFLSSPAVQCVTQLLKKLFASFISTHPSRCLSVLLESAHGGNVEWMMQIIGTDLPPSVANDLLTLGLNDFTSHFTEMMINIQRQVGVAQLNQSHDAYTAKLRSLANLLSHLIVTRSDEVITSVDAMLQRGLRTQAVGPDKMCCAFVFTLLGTSEPLLHTLTKHIIGRLNQSTLLIIVQQMSVLPPDWLLSRAVQSWSDSNQIGGGVVTLIVKLVMKLSTDDLALLIRALVPIAFEKQSCFKDEEPSNLSLVQAQTAYILEFILSHASRTLLPMATYTMDQLKIVRKVVDSDLDGAVARLFADSTPGRNYHLRFLALSAFCNGESKTCEIVSRILCAARSDMNLSSAISVLYLIRPFQPLVMQRLIKNWSFWLQKCAPTDPVVWPVNLHKLLKWEKKAETQLKANPQPVPKSLEQTQFLGYQQAISANYGGFVSAIMFESAKLHSVSDRLSCIQLLCALDTPIHQTPAHCQLIVHQLVAAIQRIFGQINEGSLCPTSHTLLWLTVDFARLFTDSQPECWRRVFMMELMHALMDAENQRAPKHDATSSPSDESLLKQNCDIGRVNVSAIVHSGVLKTKRLRISAKTDNDFDSGEILGQLMITSVFEAFCESQSGAGTRMLKPVPDDQLHEPSTSRFSPIHCRLLADSLVDVVFRDSTLLAVHNWPNYGHDDLAGYVSAAKRFDASPQLWDLLHIVASCTPCLWCAAPVLKALLGSIMVEANSSSVKMSRSLTDSILIFIFRRARLEPYFITVLAFLQSSILPDRFEYLIEVFPRVTQHETFLILSDVWKYLQSICPPISQLNERIDCIRHNLPNKFEPIGADVDVTQALDSCHHVIQANIAKLGVVYPKLFPIEL